MTPSRTPRIIGIKWSCKNSIKIWITSSDLTEQSLSCTFTISLLMNWKHYNRNISLNSVTWGHGSNMDKKMEAKRMKILMICILIMRNSWSMKSRILGRKESRERWNWLRRLRLLLRISHPRFQLGKPVLLSLHWEFLVWHRANSKVSWAASVLHLLHQEMSLPNSNRVLNALSF